MIHISMQGRLCGNPTSHENYGNVTNFRLAIYRGKDKEADFYSCSAWDRTADKIRQYFKKGGGIIVHGRQERTEWKKDGHTYHDVEIKVDSFDFPLSGGKSKEEDVVLPPEWVEDNGESTVAYCDLPEESK